ncbi:MULTISPECIES: hypothetical protein [Bacillus cereus group]|uniref:Group-specific protein n=1 Tax=Bacillus cereus TaxID=1396 RepID=A0AA44TEB9_BACCE|nr:MULTISPECIES: hypothetical protein [Bacillus cereus group]EEL51280.1 hypothetical protein bcere0022_13740 [Bacillus cereus Rock3-44]PFA25161.1 hypothetical protein CN373_01320 [Bacillus cereus]PFN06240.1 hypothetical protein COJ55_15265 [Bacillus cereus]PFO83212.1 hypothetical protein COJ77_09905 [Bacillus cereus]PFR32524.1 hypothetical protein COK19_00925 [Bacillus cereus]
MTFTLLLLAVVFLIILITLTFIFITLKNRTYVNRPYRHSLVVIALFLGHWVLVLTSFYTLLPDNVSNFIFLPIWYFLCILGFMVFIKEWKNNRIIAVSVGAFSFISLLFGMLLQGISKM